MIKKVETQKEYINKMRKSYNKFSFEEKIQLFHLIFNLGTNLIERNRIWEKIIQ